MDLPPSTDVIVVSAPRLAEAPGNEVFSSIDVDPVLIGERARIDEALLAIPGVSLFRRSGSAVANPTIQGLSVRSSAPSGAGRTLVLLDGAPLNDPFGGWVIWGAIPPDTIGRAQIFRGAGAGPYGGGALIGSVHLQERENDFFALSAEAGARGTWRFAGAGLVSDSAHSLMLAAQAQHDDGYVPVRAGRGGADTPVWLDSGSVVARLGLDLNGLSFATRLGAYSEERGSGLAGANSANSGRALSLALAQREGETTWRVQVWALESDLSNTFVSVAADRSTTTLVNDQYATPALGWGANAAIRNTTSSGSVEIGADFRASDGETREQALSVPRLRVAGGRTLMYGAYLEAWRRSGPLLLSGGVRLDHWEAFNGSRVETNTATNAVSLSLSPRDNNEVAAPI